MSHLAENFPKISPVGAGRSRAPLTVCGSLAKMSPQNCLGILSPPSIGSSSQKRRRSDAGVGAEGEPERTSSDACGTADHGKARNGCQRGNAFRDLSTSDEAVTTQAERARGARVVTWKPRPSAVEQNTGRENEASAGIGAGTVSWAERYPFDREAKGERKDRCVACYGTHDFASGGDRCGQKARGEAALQAARAQSAGRDAVVVGWQPASLVWTKAVRVQFDGGDRRCHGEVSVRGVCTARGCPELFDLSEAAAFGKWYSGSHLHGPSRDFPS